MFILTRFQDLIQIPPHEFYKHFKIEIEDKINAKYANKVVPKIGLCICMWDLVRASDGLIGHGTGNVNVNVEFHMIVFRPFKGEIIAAKVSSSTSNGITLTTEFFDDIFVPKTMLFTGTEYDEEEQTWVWRHETSELWFDVGTQVHARIETEKFEDLTPNGPLDEENATDPGEGKVAYHIEASMAEPGLGGVEWW